MRNHIIKYCWIGFAILFNSTIVTAAEYRSYDEVINTLKTLEQTSNIAKTVDIGTTVGDTIRAIKIRDNPSSEDNTEPDIRFVGKQINYGLTQLLLVVTDY